MLSFRGSAGVVWIETMCSAGCRRCFVGSGSWVLESWLCLGLGVVWARAAFVSFAWGSMVRCLEGRSSAGALSVGSPNVAGVVSTAVSSVVW